MRVVDKNSDFRLKLGIIWSKKVSKIRGEFGVRNVFIDNRLCDLENIMEGFWKLRRMVDAVRLNNV